MVPSVFIVEIIYAQHNGTIALGSRVKVPQHVVPRSRVAAGNACLAKEKSSLDGTLI
jgi:hypothetical protein